MGRKPNGEVRTAANYSRSGIQNGDIITKVSWGATHAAFMARPPEHLRFDFLPHRDRVCCRPERAMRAQRATEFTAQFPHFNRPLDSRP
jgi:hypothetical protein